MLIDLKNYPQKSNFQMDLNRLIAYTNQTFRWIWIARMNQTFKWIWIALMNQTFRWIWIAYTNQIFRVIWITHMNRTFKWIQNWIMESEVLIFRTTKEDYVIQRTTWTLCRRAFYVTGPSEWNKLCIVICQEPSTSSFKFRLKTHPVEISYG